MTFTCPKCGNRDEFDVVYEDGGEVIGERLVVTCCGCGFQGFEDVGDGPDRIVSVQMNDRFKTRLSLPIKVARQMFPLKPHYRNGQNVNPDVAFEIVDQGRQRGSWWERLFW